MLREQQIMNRIINELGEDFDKYIATFNGCDIWKIKEGELIVNKTFKRLLGIIADFNLTTVDLILANVNSNLPESKDEMSFILGHITDQYINIGGDSLLNRAMSFCFVLHHITTIDEEFGKATDILYQSANTDIVYKKESIWQKVKYSLGLVPVPYRIRGNPRAIGLLALLSGKPADEMTKMIVSHYDLM